jgi:hypothetical protein
MGGRAKTVCACFLGVFLPVLLPGRVIAQTLDWQPELVKPGDGYYQPRTKLQILISEVLSDKNKQRLTLELDGVDITQLSQYEGKYLNYRPVQDLSWGKHVLRLVENTKDGDLLEKGIWILDVRRTNNFREMELRSNISLLASERVLDNFQDDSPDSTQLQAGWNLNGSVADEDWRLKLDSDFVFNSQQEQTPRGEKFDLYNYLIRFNKENSSVNVGQHTINANNLVLQNFNRRGISVTIPTSSLQYGFTGFAMRTEPTVGFHQGLGVGDQDNQTNGLVITAIPFKNNPDKLFLSANYVSGEGSESGFAEGTETDNLVAGDAISLVADSRVLNKQLRLRGEYAKTRYDFDTTDVNIETEDDYAYSLLAIYNSNNENFVEGNYFAWDVGIEHKRLGTFFRSIGQLAGPRDKNTLRIFGNAYWETLNVNAQIGTENDNVEDISTLPTVRTNQYSVNVNYTPMEEADENGQNNIFRHASYGFSFGELQQSNQSLPKEFSGYQTDINVRDLQLFAFFSPGSWSWNIGYGISMFDDKTNISPDTQSDLTSFGINMPINELIIVSPNIQWGRLQDKDNANDSRSLFLDIGIYYDILPEKLSAVANYSLNQEESSADLINTKTTTTTVGVGIDWVIKQAKNNEIGFSLFVNGNYQDIDDRIYYENSYYQYQLFVGIKSVLPWAN